jgi:hypothetical protein
METVSHIPSGPRVGLSPRSRPVMRASIRRCRLPTHLQTSANAAVQTSIPAVPGYLNYVVFAQCRGTGATASSSIVGTVTGLLGGFDSSPGNYPYHFGEPRLVCYPFGALGVACFGSQYGCRNPSSGSWSR